MIRYKAFIKIIELGSISKAATALGYSQPGISHIIDALELEIGCPLLVRNKDCIYPTEEGKLILEYCNQIIKNDSKIQDISSQISGLKAGTIKVGVVTSLAVDYIGSIINNFSESYPNLTFFLHDYGHKEIISQISDGTIDVAFLNSSDDIPKGYTFHKLFKDNICLAVHKDHPFALYETIPMEYLNHCDLIMSTINWCNIVLEIKKGNKVKPRIKFHTSSDIIALSLVSQNLGVYITTESEKAMFPENVVLKHFTENPYRTIGICCKSGKNTSPAVKRFVKETIDKFTEI